jgi:predicted nucleic acid-binding protein
VTYLLDVNVLIALFDSAHAHHDAAHRWLLAVGLITDVYLAGLAHRNGGKLASFDNRISVAATIGAPADTLVVIPT